MAYPFDTGVPSHSGIMHPEVWAGKMLVKFYRQCIYQEISNTDYEGEIRSFGDTVHIRTTPDITISDYVKGQTLDHEQPQPANVDLLIDKGKYWSFVARTVDIAQADYNFVDDWTTDASEQLKIKVDADVLGNIFADAAAENKGATAGVISGNIDLGTTGTPVVVTKDNILDYIVDMGVVLDEQNIPESNRWVLMPPWACGMVKKSDLRDASLAGDGTSILRNGRLGMIDRFTLYMTNQLTTVSDGGTVTNMIFGHKSATTFATQLIENDGPLKDVDKFGDFYRGLQVFGYEVIKRDAIGHFYARK